MTNSHQERSQSCAAFDDNQFFPYQENSRNSPDCFAT